MNSFRLLEIVHFTEHTFRLRTERPDVPIDAGQWFSVGLPGLGVNREYSIYSAADAPYLDFLIRSVDDGFVSPKLQQAKRGDWIEIDGPYGEFSLSKFIDMARSYLFVATGTGIAPFHSFVATYPSLSYTLLHGVRTETECYGATDYANNRYKACLSRPTNGGLSNRVTDYLAKHLVSLDSVVYLCGNRSMIIDVYELLCNHGLSSNQIVTEVFF